MVREGCPCCSATIPAKTGIGRRTVDAGGEGRNAMTDGAQQTEHGEQPASEEHGRAAEVSQLTILL